MKPSTAFTNALVATRSQPRGWPLQEQAPLQWLPRPATCLRTTRRRPAAPPWLNAASNCSPRAMAANSASNCAACHLGAAQGRFSEHDVRIPQ